MHSDPTARLTVISRERLIRRHLDEGHPLKARACDVGISLRTAYKWLARYRSGGKSSLLAALVFGVITLLVFGPAQFLHLRWW